MVWRARVADKIALWDVIVRNYKKTPDYPHIILVLFKKMIMDLKALEGITTAASWPLTPKLSMIETQDQPPMWQKLIFGIMVYFFQCKNKEVTYGFLRYDNAFFGIFDPSSSTAHNMAILLTSLIIVDGKVVIYANLCIKNSFNFFRGQNSGREGEIDPKYQHLAGGAPYAPMKRAAKLGLLYKFWKSLMYYYM